MPLWIFLWALFVYLHIAVEMASSLRREGCLMRRWPPSCFVTPNHYIDSNKALNLLEAWSILWEVQTAKWFGWQFSSFLIWMPWTCEFAMRIRVIHLKRVTRIVHIWRNDVLIGMPIYCFWMNSWCVNAALALDLSRRKNWHQDLAQFSCLNNLLAKVMCVPMAGLAWNFCDNDQSDQRHKHRHKGFPTSFVVKERSLHVAVPVPFVPWGNFLFCVGWLLGVLCGMLVLFFRAYFAAIYLLSIEQLLVWLQCVSFVLLALSFVVLRSQFVRPFCS